ncbi:hypothetical protein CYY_001826 [Polysphondylium violaceum]|uniref:BD-FAE-like domain-containing protein n=1 Tax=Polysphondylium violaceum TaxID=133409 RepID=A0A8J4VA77_9MYCE|nr:hypothetical protein CYY_001826 [Polysphondylium violaceum]
MMVEDIDHMSSDLLERYKRTVYSKWGKRLIFCQLILQEIVFWLSIIGKSIRSGLYYYITFNKKHLVKDIRYSDNKPRNVCDIYSPAAFDPNNNDGSKLYPVLLFVHGGSWAFGDKIQYILMGKVLAEAGIVCMVVNYTLYPKGLIDDMLVDLDNAVKYCYENIHLYGGDKHNIHLAGHSAGAHIITLFSCTRYLNNAIKSNKTNTSKDIVGSKVKSIVALSGPFEISDHFIHETTRGLEHLSPMRPCMKGPKYFDFYSPTCIFDKVEDKSIDCNQFPKLYLLHGGQDKTVPLSSSIKLHGVLSKKLDDKSNVIFKNYPPIQHIELMFNLMDYDHDFRKDLINICKNNDILLMK